MRSGRDKDESLQDMPGNPHLACQPSEMPGSANLARLLSSGAEHFRAGRYEEAAHEFEVAVNLCPQDAPSLINLGLAYRKLGRTVDAEDSFRLALAFRPDSAKAYLNLGAICIECGAYAEAEGFLRQALVLKPDYPEALSNLGYIEFRYLDRLEEGEPHLRHALALDPTLIDARCNLGALLQEQGRTDEALAEYERALKEEPDCHEAKLNKALLLLSRGEFREGWCLYESRKLGSPHMNKPRYPFPEWDGHAPGTILIYGEQGLGDEIMFSSCIPDLIAKGRHFLLDCEPRLEKLFRRSFPGVRVLSGRQTAATTIGWPDDRSKADFQIASGSLPRLYRQSRESFPRHSGYLVADPRRVTYWRDRVRQLGPGLKVGFSWRGGTIHTRNKLRSLGITQLLPLLGLSGVQFVSLQYGDCQNELSSFSSSHGFVVNHWPDAVDDIDEAAALVCALDLTISVQTAVVHLCGALGRPVWAMVPAVAEWRYQCSGETSPWYPSLRIFRQSTLGQWHDVIDRIMLELQTLAGNRCMSC